MSAPALPQTQNQRTLRLLASSNNEKGDLFTRLSGDLFYALGYDNLRFDVAKSGREVDVMGNHRTESRRLVAECKAHVAKMGGADLNKFYGVVGRERDKNEPTAVSAYFVSLGGFTQTAIEQEDECKPDKRIILLDSDRIIEQLITARIIVNQTMAAEKAGQCAQHAGLKDGVWDGAELLGHQLGYLWAVYYARGKQRSHFALIHADGTPLAQSVAQQVITADQSCNGQLHQYCYLAPEPSQPDKIEQEHQALTHYQRWVNNECGDIQLDGLPADTDLSACKLKLEKLFVPLKVKVNSKDEDGEPTSEIWPVGKFFTAQPRFSLLAKPGGGKSTLLKRLAVAYVDPERFNAVDDQLPDKIYLPLLLRCRELKERAHQPILALLKHISQSACMDEVQSSAFARHIDHKLKAGQVLLLIDGLDEIANESARTIFATNLRSFLAMFPQMAMIATSREAGFRQIAGVIASSCAQVTMADFDQEDVAHLCQRWHVEVVGDKPEVRADALTLAKTIWDTDRIRPLAENPLMLTTLLVVRRCIGELPTRRVELYRQAVDVLIRTWNTEGYAKMDLDEALVQLSFVACAMMKAGIQQIGQKQLVKWLQQARKELEAELAYTKLSPQQFIERIEYRSSLLMQTGHEVIDGDFQAVYEFRHLTFQEYLAARGLVEQQYPDWTDKQTLLDVLEPHLEDESFKEVIPLAAVLAKRKAEPLIARLTELLARAEPEPFFTGHTFNLLQQCLLDEVLISAVLVKQAIQQIARLAKANNGESILRLLQGRFGEITTEVIESSFFDLNINWPEYSVSFSALACQDLWSGHFASDALYQQLVAGLTSADNLAQCKAALLCMKIAYHNSPKLTREQFLALQSLLVDLLWSKVPQVNLCVSWALAWFGDNEVCDYHPSVELLNRLLVLSSNQQWPELARFFGWAFASQPLLARDVLSKTQQDIFRQHFGAVSKKAVNYEEVKAVLTWYRCFQTSDVELLAKIKNIDKLRYPRFRKMAKSLEKSIADAKAKKLIK